MQVTHLLKILDASIKKNGPDTLITLSHLNNIIKMLDKKETEKRERRANRVDLCRDDDCGPNLYDR